jgi:hypothetical protein
MSPDLLNARRVKSFTPGFATTGLVKAGTVINRCGPGHGPASSDDAGHGQMVPAPSASRSARFAHRNGTHRARRRRPLGLSWQLRPGV